MPDNETDDTSLTPSNKSATSFNEGNLNPHNKNKKSPISIPKSKRKDLMEGEIRKTPGPGNYSPSKAEKRMPRPTIGTSRRITVEDPEDSPGPGQYPTLSSFTS
eukprot:CAMPEP_0114974032 /NCGR_PEP_ID=MMETSP0216-20121206/1297_1 /TAXON_ID=223996 /ORGANISM="Protocruzia adherens, Strain Boccale" /LENGTH=103 /DNA_ID=CAMNT_0002334615 /DNA_START=205 /DNA_END=512 /DNA_ORIENTATION=+